MDVYTNRFHGGHLYIRMDAHEADALTAAQFLNMIEQYDRPLEIFAASDDDRLIALLTETGFLRKRRCFERSVRRTDLRLPLSGPQQELSKVQKGTPAYEACAQMMFWYYADTHAAVNPLTASQQDFSEILPNTVLYASEQGAITAAAFMEDNEIAYVCAADRDRYPAFARSLLAYLFDRYERVEFEADDTDWAATCLKDLFSVADERSWDTYIKSNRDAV